MWWKALVYKYSLQQLNPCRTKLLQTGWIPPWMSWGLSIQPCTIFITLWYAHKEQRHPGGQGHGCPGNKGNSFLTIGSRQKNSCTIISSNAFSVDRAMKSTNTFLLLCSQHLWNTTKRQKGISRQVPSLKWSSCWASAPARSLNWRWSPGPNGGSGQTAASGHFMNQDYLSASCAKITTLGALGVPLAWPANNHSGEFCFCPVLEEWANNPGLCIQSPPFVSSHRPWTSHTGLFGCSFHAGKWGANSHLSSCRGARCTSSKLSLFEGWL